MQTPVGVLIIGLALLVLTGCRSDSCDLGDAGCECTAVRTCEEGATCFQRWCWGAQYPAPQTYYYTPRNLEDTQAVRVAVANGLALQRGQVLADIGCGQGYLSYAAAEAVGGTGKVIATDLDPGALEHTKRYLDSAEDRSALGALKTVKVDDPRQTGLEGEADGSIDVILMINSVVFEAKPDDAGDVAYLQQLLRKLRPGGRIIYHRDWLDFDDLARPGAAKLFVKAGLEVAPDLAMPPGIPETTYYLPEGPKGPRMDLTRGYIMVVRRPVG